MVEREAAAGKAHWDVLLFDQENQGNLKKQTLEHSDNLKFMLLTILSALPWDSFLLQSPTPDSSALAAASSTDLLGNIQVSFQNFLQSGQAGAMTIGIVAGYVIRGITK